MSVVAWLSKYNKGKNMTTQNSTLSNSTRLDRLKPRLLRRSKKTGQNNIAQNITAHFRT